MPPIARPLFTGKTPESFSFGFAQGLQNPQTIRNLLPVTSTLNNIKTNNDFLQEQIKNNANNVNNAGTISPQITFLASQGAHVPSANTQQSKSRVFTTERTTLPQLVNYDATVKEDPVIEHPDNNKGLWRWQYGLNANLNQTPEKNTISRSSGVGDDVMINFGDMTSDQYTKMLKTQLEPNVDTTQEDQIQNDQIAQPSNTMRVYKELNHYTKVQTGIKPDPKLTMLSTESNFVSTQTSDWQNNYNPYSHGISYQSTENSESRQNTEDSFSSRSKLITQNNFVPQSQLITQSYDYDDISYEPKRISRSSSTLTPVISPYHSYNNINNHEGGTQNNLWPSQNEIDNFQKISTTEAPVISTTLQSIKFKDFVIDENKNDFKPMLPSYTAQKQKEQTTTTETIEENIFESNMFLKNLFNSNKDDQYEGYKIKEENKNHKTKIQTEHKLEKAPKLIQMQAKPHNDIKGKQNKPLDFIDIMNYLSAKNQFESIKTKPKSKFGSKNYNQKSEVRFIPVQHDQVNSDYNDDDKENVDQNTSNLQTSYYHPEELRGMIKNYKVLQRNNSAFKNGQDVEQLRRDLSPPPVKMLQSNLPPLGRAGPAMKSYLPPIYV